MVPWAQRRTWCRCCPLLPSHVLTLPRAHALTRAHAYDQLSEKETAVDAMHADTQRLQTDLARVAEEKHSVRVR